ncbi:ubiquitin-conjugating enzyme [Apiospora phragmitis]|uniref:Ubiquitin-conjugating enzyme n=1 Tax=Apiospora phragmitis TaxID=2905665 RepID=A0ABR1W5F2_9PEZI
MASKAAHKRLTREYKSISQNPPPYIEAHPSDSNILEWHYIITGPEETPYYGGQYWGTLIFPSNYPFAPPAIRMHTPSGRFQPSTRLCLSISDFHLSPSTRRGSTERERKFLAARSRWWNSTAGGSQKNAAGKGNVKAGDGGAKFRAEWPDVDKENWQWMAAHKIDPATGQSAVAGASCGPQLGIAGGSGGQTQAVVDAVVQRRDAAGRGWLRNKWIIGIGVILAYTALARWLGSEGESRSESL